MFPSVKLKTNECAVLLSDIPGVLASITATLRDAGINIANCHLGRQRLPTDPLHSTALAIFHIDGDCPSEVVEKLGNIEAIHCCKVIHV